MKIYFKDDSVDEVEEVTHPSTSENSNNSTTIERCIAE